MAEPAQIALVEDDAAVLDSLQLYLDCHDLKTSRFTAAATLLAAVDGGVQFNCIGSDVRMPGLSGFDLVHYLKARGVMGLAAAGLSNREIGSRLNFSPKTVEYHRAWVMERIGAKNLADLVRIATHIQAR